MFLSGAPIVDRGPRKLHAIFGGSDQRSVPRGFFSRSFSLGTDQRSVPRENRCFLRFFQNRRKTRLFPRSFRAPISDRCPERTVVSSDFEKSEENPSFFSTHKWVGKKNEGLFNMSIFFFANVQIPPGASISFLYFPRLLRSRGKYRKERSKRGDRSSIFFPIFSPTPSESGKIRPFSERKRTGKKKILDLSFPLRGIRQMKIFLSTHEMGR